MTLKEPGIYTILPCTFNPYIETKFALNLYANEHIESTTASYNYTKLFAPVRHTAHGKRTRIHRTRTRHSHFCHACVAAGPMDGQECGRLLGSSDIPHEPAVPPDVPHAGHGHWRVEDAVHRRRGEARSGGGRGRLPAPARGQHHRVLPRHPTGQALPLQGGHLRQGHRRYVPPSSPSSSPSPPHFLNCVAVFYLAQRAPSTSCTRAWSTASSCARTSRVRWAASPWTSMSPTLRSPSPRSERKRTAVHRGLPPWPSDARHDWLSPERIIIVFSIFTPNPLSAFCKWQPIIIQNPQNTALGSSATHEHQLRRYRLFFQTHARKAKMWTVAVLTAVAAVLLAYYLLKPKARGSLRCTSQVGCLIVAVLVGGCLLGGDVRRPRGTSGQPTFRP